MAYYLTTALIAIAATLAGLWGSYSLGAEAGRAEVQQRWDAESARRAARIVDAQVEARATEQALTVAAAKQLKAKNAELARTRHLYAAELDRLRDRPDARADDRPGEAASPAATGVGCTGAGLARPDAAFLAGYAADARRLQLEFERCSAAYDKAVNLSSTIE